MSRWIIYHVSAHTHLRCLVGTHVGAEVKVKEEAEDGDAIDDERPLHPQVERTLYVDWLGRVQHTHHKLNLKTTHGFTAFIVLVSTILSAWIPSSTLWKQIQVQLLCGKLPFNINSNWPAELLSGISSTRGTFVQPGLVLTTRSMCTSVRECQSWSSVQRMLPKCHK